MGRPRLPRSPYLLPLALVLVTLVTLPATGCIGVTAHLLYFLKGEKVPAEFNGLKGKRVAVVCVSNSTSYGSGSEAMMLARAVGTTLQKEVKDIKVIRQEEIADWIDVNDWDHIDYRNIGRGVNAESVLAIELEQFRLKEGQTMYKGRATVALTVFDMTQGGKIVFRKEPKDFEFPEHGARHATETNETSFRKIFLHILAHDVAKRFYSYDAIENVANDARFLRE